MCVKSRWLKKQLLIFLSVLPAPVTAPSLWYCYCYCYCWCWCWCNVYGDMDSQGCVWRSCESWGLCVCLRRLFILMSLSPWAFTLLLTTSALSLSPTLSFRLLSRHHPVLSIILYSFIYMQCMHQSGTTFISFSFRHSSTLYFSGFLLTWGRRLQPRRREHA